MRDRFDAVVVGAGAAGIAALRRLRRAGVEAVALEARPRIGGRAHTVVASPGLPLDHGCGWMHSADVNPLVPLVERAGFTLDKSPPHWLRQAANRDFPPEDQAAFRRAREAFEDELERAAKTGVDRPAAELLPPGGRWNPLLEAVSSYYNGAEYDQVSVLDYAAYEDTGVNYRVRDGYGTAIASFAETADIVTDCPVTMIRHDGPELRLETAKGTIGARTAIVAVPTPMLSEGPIAFSPGLPDKVAAAAGLPLGLADKAFLSLAAPEMFQVEGHLFGHTDRAETASYHLRPFGRPYIEAYLGGRWARALEGEGPGATAAYAIEELVGLVGSDLRGKIAPIAVTHWAADPWALGSYSHALPGHAGDRALLAAPVEDRLFFAGEATHASFYSTCHGAWMSGERAADEALQSLNLDRHGRACPGHP